jgi:hypothetical protein
MPTGRFGIDYSDILARNISAFADASTIVFDATKAGGSASVGLAVTESADDTIALCADGDPIMGKLLKVEPDGLCTVHVRGFATLPGGTGATLTRGRRTVGALLGSAKGYIRTAATGTAAELNAEGPIIWNAGTTTAVVVDFG